MLIRVTIHRYHHFIFDACDDLIDGLDWVVGKLP